jgi:hypothetical protein
MNNYQRHLIFNMAAINKRRERNRVNYDILNNLSSVDLVYDKQEAPRAFTWRVGPLTPTPIYSRPPLR